ncbi:MAG: TRAP transporter small permease [Pseudorhodobacter sp.]
MLRSLIHRLYLVCGYAAAFFLAAIAVATLAQIIARQMGRAVETTEISGFFLAASTFLALAYTFVNGGHVRITILPNVVPRRVTRWVELWCCAVGIGITFYAALQMTLFTLETYRFGDLSPGMMAVPLWIPQTAVAVGLAVMCIGIIEQATLVLTGRPPGYESNIDSTAE